MAKNIKWKSLKALCIEILHDIFIMAAHREHSNWPIIKHFPKFS